MSSSAAKPPQHHLFHMGGGPPGGGGVVAPPQQSVGGGGGGVSSAGGGGYVPYFEYHGIEQGAYYGMPYRQEPGSSPHILLPRTKSSSGGGGTSKKSFASRLATQLDKLTGGGTIRGDKTTQQLNAGRTQLHHDLFRGPLPPDGTNRPHLILNGNGTSPHPRRTFRNVFHNGHGGSSRRSNSGVKYFAPWDTSVPTTTTPSSSQQPPHYVHPSHYAELDEFENFALSTNVCLCNDQQQIGTQRIKNISSSKCNRCRTCGLEKVRPPPPPTAAAYHGAPNSFLLRRAQSDESLSNSCHNNNNFNCSDPYELMRRRRMHHQPDQWYDDHDLDYAEADYIYNSGGRKLPPPRAVLRQQVGGGGGRSLDRRTHRSDTNSSGRNTVRNSSLSSGSKKQHLQQQQQQEEAKDMRQQSSNNDSETKTAGAALPAAEAQQSKGGCISDNYSFRTNRSNRSSRSNGSDNIVTVNGGHGTKSSSIIYLSPDTKKPPKPQRSNSGPSNNDGGNEDEDPWNRTTFITVNHPAVHMSVQPHSTTIEVRNSETSTGSEPFTEEEEEEEDTGSCISDDSSDTSDKERTSSEEEHNHLQSVINNENLKLLNKVKVFQEKQKKAAAAAAEEQREKENKEALQELDRALDIGGGDSAAEESDYDADCSQLESPRKVQSVIASMLSDHDSASPQRTPRKRQAVVVVPDAAAIPEEEETQDSFQTIVAAAGPLATKRSSDSLPKGAKKKPTARLLFDNPTATTKSAQLAERRNKQISKESRSVSDTSIASGGQHTSKPAESEEEFQPNISKGFSCEILKELYGSKTSLVRKPSSSSGGESAMSGGDNHGGESYKRRQRMPDTPLLPEPGSAGSSNRPSRRDSVTPDRINHGYHHQNSQQAHLHHHHHQHMMFNDTTRLRHITRPSLKDAFSDSPSNGSGSGAGLGRRGISQSFKEKLASPVRPREPPPPPPPAPAAGTQPSPDATFIYDIDENEEDESGLEKKAGPVKILHTSSSIFSTNSLKKLKPPKSSKKERSKSFTPKSKMDLVTKASIFNRSFSQIPKSFSYNSLDRGKAKKNKAKLAASSSSGGNLDMGPHGSAAGGHHHHQQQHLSSADLVTIIPPLDEQERMTFKDIRKILSSPSISSADNSSLSSTQSFNPSGASSKVLDSSSRGSPSKRYNDANSMEHIYEEIPDPNLVKTKGKGKRPLPPLPVPGSPTGPGKESIKHKLSTTSCTSSIASHVSSTLQHMHDPNASPVKSIFEGATKYDILHYLEDAKERGLTDVELDEDADDLEEEDGVIEEEDEEEEEDEDVTFLADGLHSSSLAMASRSHSNRISNISSCSSSGSSCTRHPVQINRSTNCLNGGNNGSGSKWTSVEIERNDSGLGSETGGKLKRRPARVSGSSASNSGGSGSGLVGPTVSSGSSRNLLQGPVSLSHAIESEQICEDCDQVILPMGVEQQELSEVFFDPSGPVCFNCAKRRCERKEIITEIIETEIKYGRDLRIIQEEFQRPMAVAGLLTPEQLTAIFLNVDELSAVNGYFTEALKDAIEIALDEGDEDLCSVCIGKIFLKAESMLGSFKSYCTRQGSASALLAAMEKDKELLRIFLKVSQMENTILRRMNLSSFLMVPVQRVTKYPLLLSRLLKVTPSHHSDRIALQESRERIEHHLEHMNQEARDQLSSTKLWRRISMINVSSYRKMDSQLDVLGNTTWGIRKMALDVLGWSKEQREDVNFVLESKLLFTQATETSWRNKGYFTVKMSPVSALLVTLGRNSLEPPPVGVSSELGGSGTGHLNFPRETGVKQAALLLIREKNNRYSMVRDPMFLDKCIICWEQDWEDCFEVQEFAAKESFIFKADDMLKTRQWFKSLQFYALSLGQWRKRRNALANIMINGMGRKEYD